MGTGVGKSQYERGIYNTRYVLYGHIIAWGIFIAYELSVLSFILPHFTPAIDIALHYAINICLFYLNCLVIFPRLYQDKTVIQLPLILGVLLEIALYLVIVFAVDFSFDRLHITEYKYNQKLTYFIVTTCYRGIYFLFFSTCYWLASYLLQSRIKIDELIQQQLEDKNQQLELQKKVIVSENAFLKAQINPHFLFNSLNFIYNTIHKVSASAAEAVILLSDITRYSLRKSDASGQMPIHEEIEQINNLIELNQLRFNGELQIRFEVGLITASFTIPPLLLISFVENIFKYGKLNDPETPAVISIKEVDGALQFRSKNVIQKRKGTEGYGVGLENTKLRLNNIFADRHRLDIATTENIYTVELDIQISPC